MLPVPDHCGPTNLYTKTGRLTSVRQRTLAARCAMQSGSQCLTLLNGRKRLLVCGNAHILRHWVSRRSEKKQMLVARPKRIKAHHVAIAV